MHEWTEAMSRVQRVGVTGGKDQAQAPEPLITDDGADQGRTDPTPTRGLIHEYVADPAEGDAVRDDAREPDLPAVPEGAEAERAGDRRLGRPARPTNRPVRALRQR